MTTNIRTAKTSYRVESIHTPFEGPTVITVRSASGKARKLTRKDVGRTRFDAAIANFTRKIKEGI